MGKSPCCVFHSFGKLELPVSWPILGEERDPFLTHFGGISAPNLANIAGPSRRHSPPPACHHTAITSNTFAHISGRPRAIRRDDGAVWGTGYTFVPFLSVLYHRRCGRLRPTPTAGKATHGAGLCMQEIAGLLIFQSPRTGSADPLPLSYARSELAGALESAPLEFGGLGGEAGPHPEDAAAVRGSARRLTKGSMGSH